MSSPILRHPNEADLMRLLDGELAGREAREIRRHTESCWQCRRDLNEMQTAIDAFLRFRDVAMLSRVPPPPRSWPDLRGRCEDLDGNFAVVETSRWPMWRMAAAAGAMALAALASVVLFRPAPPVAPVVRLKSAVPAQVERAVRSLPPGTAGTPEVGRTSETSLLSAEVQVLAVLHRLGADLGEAVEVTAGKDAVVVHGTALDPARAAVIRAALMEIARVTWQLSEPPGVAPDGGGGTVIAPRAAVFGVKDDLANAAIDESDAVLARAHALGRLSARFSGVTLGEGEARAVQEIEDDHRMALRRHAGQLRKLLAPVAEEFRVQESAAGLERPIVELARELDELVSAGFAGAPSPNKDTEIMARLQRVLRELSR